ncbi:MAG: hypothetical protein JWN02_2101 [Acidobacteria bacterium]|nr:hypothetical protein [Acidobacteriota bacterium]
MRLVAAVAALVSAFFMFYTVRLLAVSAFLQRIRPGGQGAYIGAVAFPLLALFFGWLAFRCWKRPASVVKQ